MNLSSERLLGRFARSWIGRPFVWGETDCSILALAWVDTIIGEDRFVRQVLGRYDSPETAAAFSASFGKSLADLLLDAGFTPAPAGVTPTGSIILVASEDYTRAHVCLNQKILSADETDGVVVVPRRLIPRDREVFRCP